MGLARSTRHGADRRPALLNGDESAISYFNVIGVNGAPPVSVGRGGCTKRDAERGNGANGDNNSSKHSALLNMSDLSL
jgi:hypothetical protein